MIGRALLAGQFILMSELPSAYEFSATLRRYLCGRFRVVVKTLPMAKKFKNRVIFLMFSSIVKPDSRHHLLLVL